MVSSRPGGPPRRHGSPREARTAAHARPTTVDPVPRRRPDDPRSVHECAGCDRGRQEVADDRRAGSGYRRRRGRQARQGQARCQADQCLQACGTRLRRRPDPRPGAGHRARTIGDGRDPRHRRGARRAGHASGRPPGPSHIVATDAHQRRGPGIAPGERGCGDHRHRHPAKSPGSPCRRRLRLHAAGHAQRTIAVIALARRPRPRDARRRHRRRPRQHPWRRRRRARRAPLVGARVHGDRLQPHLVDRLRHRLGHLEARSEQLGTPADRGGQHEPPRQGHRRPELWLLGHRHRAPGDLPLDRARDALRRRRRQRFERGRELAPGVVQRGRHGVGDGRLRRQARRTRERPMRRVRPARQRRHVRRFQQLRARRRRRGPRRLRPVDVPRQHLRDDIGDVHGDAARGRSRGPVPRRASRHSRRPTCARRFARRGHSTGVPGAIATARSIRCSTRPRSGRVQACDCARPRPRSGCAAGRAARP